MMSKKEFTAMTALERRFHDACRRVCLPIHQVEIYNEFLNAIEKEIVESGTKEDVEKRELYRRMNNLDPIPPRDDYSGFYKMLNIDEC